MLDLVLSAKPPESSTYLPCRFWIMDVSPYRMQQVGSLSIIAEVSPQSASVLFVHPAVFALWYSRICYSALACCLLLKAQIGLKR